MLSTNLVFWLSSHTKFCLFFFLFSINKHILYLQEKKYNPYRSQFFFCKIKICFNLRILIFIAILRQKFFTAETIFFFLRRKGFKKFLLRKLVRGIKLDFLCFSLPTESELNDVVETFFLWYTFRIWVMACSYLFLIYLTYPLR